jgi:hypothetical protein
MMPPFEAAGVQRFEAAVKLRHEDDTVKRCDDPGDCAQALISPIAPLQDDAFRMHPTNPPTQP